MIDIVLAVSVCGLIALLITPVDKNTARFKHFKNKDPMQIIYMIKKEEEALGMLTHESIPNNGKIQQENQQVIASKIGNNSSSSNWLVSPSSTNMNQTPINSTNMVVHLISNSLTGRFFNYFLTTFQRIRQERNLRKVNNEKPSSSVVYSSS